ncbi:hypothetical protein F5884DRAFT_787651 [Xylogone sp. PMI_703]|nr:hypothetical protein F5884DRAFT_787651 [Xylogone sp. PMI_703]
MRSFQTAAIIAGSLLLGAQAQLSYPINITAVPIATRTQWCQSQLVQCPLLCLQNNGTDASKTSANDCDPETLDFHCVCGNGISPNASQYSQTIPYFECQEYGNECVAGCGGDSSCQSDCRDNNPCGAQNPTRVNVTSTSSTVGPTGTNGAPSSTSSNQVFDGFGSSGSSNNNNNKGNAAPATIELGRSYGLAIVFTGLFAGFALVL